MGWGGVGERRGEERGRGGEIVGGAGRITDASARDAVPDVECHGNRRGRMQC